MNLEDKLPQNLLNCLNSVKDAAKRIWENPKLTHYTNHDIRHSENIVSILNKMLSDVPDDLLNEHECFILLTSVYLHDIGMQSATHAGIEDKSDYDLDDKEIVRKNHHTSSKTMILESISSSTSLGLELCRDYVPFISILSESHSSKIPVDTINDTSFQGEEIKLNFLSALLKLADELDRDYRRVNIDDLKLWDIPVDSKFHWWVHHYTQSVHIENGKIKLYFRFPEEYCDDGTKEVFIKKTVYSIKEQLTEVYDILWEKDVKLYLAERDIEVECLEGVVEKIPSDLQEYIEKNILKPTPQSTEMKAGVYWYEYGTVYSDNLDFLEHLSAIFEFLDNNEYQEAINEIKESLNLVISPIERINLLLIAGNCYYILGKLKEAQEYYENAYELSTKENVKDIYKDEAIKGFTAASSNLGLIFFDKGDLEESYKFFNESLEIHEDIGYKKGIAGNLSNIGLIYLDKGELSEAYECFSKSLEIYEEIGYKKGIANNLANIGLINYYNGKLNKSIVFIKDSYKIHEEIGDRKGIAGNLTNMGLIYLDKRDLSEAYECFSKSLEIYEEIGYKKGIANNLGNIGLIYIDEKDLSEAYECFSKSLEIYEEIGYKKGIANELGNIGIIHKEKGEYKEALECQKKALEIDTAIKNKYGIANDLGNIGIIHKEKGEYKEALECQKKALETLEELGYKQEQDNIIENIKYILHLNGDFLEALEYEELISSLKRKRIIK